MLTPQLASLLTAALTVASPFPIPGNHQEAPAVRLDPKVESTDFYSFMAYEPGKSDQVILLANYLPLQDPGSGPIYFTFDPEARYEINIDNNADAREDISFRFAFDTTVKDLTIPVNGKNVPIPFANVGPILTGDDSQLNKMESYSVDVVFGKGPASTTVPVSNSANGATRFTKPVDNIGAKSIPNYGSYADQFVYNINLPGGFTGRMFVGQRKDPSAANLGEIFDLINTDPLGPENGESDERANKNVTSLILEIPKSFLGAPGQPVLGTWTSAWLPEETCTCKKCERKAQSILQKPLEFEQVSRLGMPLVIETIIGLKDQNRFQTSRPEDTQFLQYFTEPTLPEIIEILFGPSLGVQAPEYFPRADFEAMYYTGFGGVNANGSFAEMMRLNMDIPPAPAGTQLRHGLIAGDFAGFPNGRRPGDDVIDITLRVAMGAVLPPPLAPSGQLPFTDGVFIDDSSFDSAFPYLRDPIPGSPQ